MLLPRSFFLQRHGGSGRSSEWRSFSFSLGFYGLEKESNHRPKKKPHHFPTIIALPKKRLGLLEEQFSNRSLAEVAAEASLAVRGFLAGALAEPALYETTEEFSQRDVHLPKDAADLLNDLNTTKYSPSHASPELAEELVNRCQACLKTLHTANTLGK